MRSHTDDANVLKAEDDAAQTYLMHLYPIWMDIHVMIFLGFGFLMCFLKAHNFTTLAQNFLAAAWAL